MVKKTAPKTYFIHTFGCQANKADSERIACLYEQRGYQQAQDWQNCSVLIINTCSVRQRAEDRVVGLLKNIKEYFKTKHITRPEIILAGCMLHYGKTKLQQKLPLVDKFLTHKQVSFDYWPLRQDKNHAFIPISEGCNSFCTYCIVPYARGREKSRPMAEIIKEAQDLAKKGYTQITLLGQNVNSYGLEKVGITLRKMLLNKKIKISDIPSNQSQYLKPQGIPPFIKLLREISKIHEIKTIRFMSVNPWDFHQELVDEIAHNPKIDRYIHIALQSGSDDILKKMNRGYSANDYYTLIQKLKTVDQSLSFGTDIIVGFPGETEQDFQDTLQICQKIKFKVAFVNIYSPRPGTVSAKLYPDDIPFAIKKKRWEILDQLINKDNLQNRPKIV